MRRPVLLILSLLMIGPVGTAHLGADSPYLPALEDDDLLVIHDYYTLSYSEKHEQAEWVAYELTREEVMGPVERSDSFREDLEVTTGSASLKDYRGSGFDRGHLAPAADMKFSEEAMRDSFFMSNMSPQRPAFNRGIWKQLEALVRDWAYLEGAIQIVTGPVLTDWTPEGKEASGDLPPGDGRFETIGPEGVSVPNYYHKVVLDIREPGFKAIGFILPNQRGEAGLEFYAVSVDEVEYATGLDFFPGLPDELEESLESALDISLWSFF
ncbi:MAG: DNA/RNA non-specific endonuclease [Spirochaetaceae bacterium]|nr:DNA/RNA non-specific endonuclease [Spirochaetaceae bacterium]MDT8298634.1 DNA/RNA non-specific endonuclease [Spirochaetaceae bacterium]